MNEGVNGGVNERYGTQDAWHECGAKLGAFELDFGSILDRFWQKPGVRARDHVLAMVNADDWLKFRSILDQVWIDFGDCGSILDRFWCKPLLRLGSMRRCRAIPLISG
jgi:hypothetical protein